MKIENIKIVHPICRYYRLAEIYCIRDELARPVWLREKFFLDKNGKVVAYFQYKDAFMSKQLTDKHDDLFIVKLACDEKYNLIKVIDNKQVLINSYEDIEFGVEDGCFAVKNEGVWGFINEEGEEIIKPQYEDYCSFCSGLAAVRKDGKWGFINKQNEVVIPFEYQISDYSCFNKYAPVGKNEKFGYIDKKGKVVIPFKYESAMCVFSKSKIFPVKLDGKWGGINKKENIVVPFEYDDIEIDDIDFYYSIIKRGNYAKKNKTFDTYGLVDARVGKIIVPCQYNFLRPNGNSIYVGIITEDEQERYGLVDYKNNKITDFVYERMYEYTNDLWLYEAKSNGKYGYIDETGKAIIDFKYYRVNQFLGNYALVENFDGTNEVINKNGEVVLGPIDKEIFNIGAGMFFVQGSNPKEYELVKIKEG